MISCFTLPDLKDYLKIELYHSLDIHNLHEKSAILEGAPPKSFSHKVFSLLTEFYGFLAKLRYSVKIDDTVVKSEDYNSFVEKEYNHFIRKINECLLTLFRDPTKGIRTNQNTPVDIDILESTLIYNFYDLIQEWLSSALHDYEINTKTKLVDFITKLNGAPHLIIQRFILENKTNFSTDKYDYDCGLRFLKNKQCRFNGSDRALYWGFIKEKHNEIFYLDTRSLIFRFLTQQDDNLDVQCNSWIVAFLLLVFIKYHFILHQHAHGAYEFRNLQQHIDRFEASREKIRRAQKVFTFTRLVAKYFPLIFAPDDEQQSRAIAKIIEILSYIRRGFAYNSLGRNQNAFNDYTSAEKQASVLRDECGENNVEFIFLYREFTIPFIYSLKGELYRKDHAFYNAHQYLCNSITRLESVKEKKNRELLNLSFKIARIKIAKGKTFLELGEFRKSLKWYLRALEHLLNIFGLNRREITDSLSNLLNYLEETRHDPKIKKGPLFDKLKTVTEKMEGIIVKNGLDVQNLLTNYGILLSDLFNRISLVVFLLNLPDYDVLQQKTREGYENANSSEVREEYKKLLCRNLIACKWLVLALRLNPRNSLALFNDMLFSLQSCEDAKDACTKMKTDLGVGFPEKADLMEFGNPRDIIYRLISKVTIELLSQEMSKEDNKDDKDRNVAKYLLERLLLYTDDFSTKNAEFFKYLMMEPHENESIRDKKPDIFFYFLQRWSSINPSLPRPSTFKMKGGGYFITFKGKGIAIDPGFNFVENLYSEGFSISDIDCVIVTHDHIDHTADIDTILSLHYKRYKISQEKKCLTLLLNPSTSARYSFIDNQDPGLFNERKLTPEDKRREVFEDFAIEAKETQHLDIFSPRFSNSIGLILVFYPGLENEFKIGITGDTQYRKDIIDQFIDVDILIAHINGTPFEELTQYCKINPLQDENIKNLLSEMRKKGFGSVINEIIYSLKSDPNDEHMHLHGVLETYKSFIERDLDSDKERLFIVSEISEEMGSYRHKVATSINQQFTNQSNKVRVLTADIGMAIRVKYLENKRRGIIELRCSRCHLNNDYTDGDKFHNIKNIKEVCLKGDDEGIFYYCRRHDPESIDRSFENYGFAERIERYQPFKHIDIPII